jgi:Sec-independent protein translocase protein TatA
MEVIFYIIVLAVVLYFFGATLKKLGNTTNDVMSIGANATHEAAKVGDAQIKMWSKEQRADISKKAKELKNTPSWDELDELLK